MSAYYKTLPPEAQTMYRNKLTLQDESKNDVILPDPFSVSGWADDPTSWPDVGMGSIYFINVLGTYTHEHLAAYKSLEGYNFFKSGHVQPVYLFEVATVPNICFLRAKVIPSQRVTKKPYEAWICLEKSGRVRCAHCQCMAGLG